MATQKRRGAGEGSIRKVIKVDKKTGKKREYWEGRYSIPNDSGKPDRHSIYGPTQKEVQDRLREITGELSAGNYKKPSDITIHAWFDEWLSDHCGDKKYLTVKSYKATVENHIKPYFGSKKKLRSLTLKDVQSFYNSLQSTKASGKIKAGTERNISAKTIRNIHGVMTVALNCAVDLELIPKNPASRAKIPQAHRKEINPLTDEQVRLFMAASAGDDYEAPLKFILFTGTRESEAIGLTWDCVDFKTNTVKICKQLQRRAKADGGYTLAPLKNNKTREIVCSSFVMQLLRQRQLEQSFEEKRAGDAWVGWKNDMEKQKAFVFTKPDGDHVNATMMYNHYKKIAAAIGAPESRVHDLRHTYAVLSLQNGDDVKTVQGNLGHATASFTLDVYGHVSETMKQNSADRMQKYIDSIG